MRERCYALRVLRRAVLVLVAMVSAAGPGLARAEPALGAADAPVTIVEYGSLTCGACVRFHRQVLPELQKRFIDAGQVRFVYRDFPTSANAVRGAVAARCVAPAQYHAMLDRLFWSAPEWSKARDLDAALAKQADALGLGGAAFRRCLADPANRARIEEDRRAVARKLGVIGTPTFVINGRAITGFQTLEQMGAHVREALNTRSP